jgi:hypothetical protein
VNIKALVDKANQLIDAERHRIEDLAKVLAVPKAKHQPKARRPHKNLLVLPSNEAGGVEA